MNELSRAKKELLLRCMVRGNGVHDCAEIVDIDPGTVQRYLRIFGEALLAMHHRLISGLRVRRLELDEIWSYVYGKSYNRHSFGPTAPDWAGDIFTWTALDPDSKLLVAYHVSRRSLKQAKIFLFDVRSKVDGPLLITTDALRLYKRAINFTFGSDAQHVVIEKVLESKWNRETGDRQVTVVQMVKKPQSSAEVDLNLASTSHNERHNGTIRNFISRFQRLTYGFSKKVESHVYAHAIYATYYNFRKKHRSLGQGTPAMKAGLSDHVWSFADFIDEVDRYWASKKFTGIPDQNISAGEVLEAMKPGTCREDHNFFVCLNTLQDTALIHVGSCRNCRFGLGRGGSGEYSRWYSFELQEDAEKSAEILAPGENGVCSICIKRQYRTRFQPI